MGIFLKRILLNLRNSNFFQHINNFKEIFNDRTDFLGVINSITSVTFGKIKFLRTRSIKNSKALF